MVNLIDQLKSEFAGNIVSRLAHAVGEKPWQIETALGGLVPAAVGALASKAASREGAGELFRALQQSGMVTNAAGFDLNAKSSAAPSELAALGGPMASTIFGSRVNTLTDWLASFSGIQKRSAMSLLSLAMPLIVGVVGKHASAGGGLSSGSLASLLATQIPFVNAAAPSGLTDLLGLTGRELPAVGLATAPGKSRFGWVASLVALLALLGIIVWATGRQSRAAAGSPDGPKAEADPSVSSVPGPEAGPVMSIYGLDLGSPIDRELPNGATLRIPERGVESQLLALIENQTATVADDRWFSLDRVEFESGSSTLNPSAQEQLTNLAAILKAYPNMKLKLGGYTDSSGDDADNLQLSGERAANTMEVLVGLGTSATRLEAEGYGEKQPVASNDTPDGRQRNRRIDVRVTKK